MSGNKGPSETLETQQTSIAHGNRTSVCVSLDSRLKVNSFYFMFLYSADSTRISQKKQSNVPRMEEEPSAVVVCRFKGKEGGNTRLLD